MWNGNLVRESTKQGNDKVARQMEAAHRTSLAKGEVGIREKKRAPTLTRFINDRIEPWAKSRPSWIWYRSGIRSVLTSKNIANKDLDRITSEDVAAYAAFRESRGLQVGSVNRELRVLRRVLRLAVEWGMLEKSPRVQMLGKEKRRERVVGNDEFAKYLTCAQPLLAAVAIVLSDTGLRPDECHRMDWSDISFVNGQHGKLLVRHGKTPAARRELPLTIRVRGLLLTRWENVGFPEEGWVWPATTKTGHIDHSTLKKQHQDAIRRSGVRPFLLYSLRHTFATKISPHVDAWTLCKIMGWASLSVAMTYIHPSDDRVLDAFSDLGGHKSGHNSESHVLAAESHEGGNATELGSCVVSADGLEPSTHALKGHCSAS